MAILASTIRLDARDPGGWREKLNREGLLSCKSGYIWAFLAEIWTFLAEIRINCELNLTNEFSVISLEGTTIPHLEQGVCEDTTSGIPWSLGGVVRRGKVD